MQNKLSKEYSHYYKKIPRGVEYVDVYRVLELFEVTNPSISHAIKKLLVAGNRGHKDLDKDVKEAIDSLQRYLEMREEESPNVVSSSYGPGAMGANGPAGPNSYRSDYIL